MYFIHTKSKGQSFKFEQVEEYFIRTRFKSKGQSFKFELVEEYFIRTRFKSKERNSKFIPKFKSKGHKFEERKIGSNKCA